MGAIRYWLRFAGIVLGLIALVPLHYACRITGIRSPWPRRFLGYVGWVAGVRVKTIGTYDRSNTLFVANHATWLDIMIIGGTTGAAFVAKEELKESWFVGWLASLNDSVWVQRSDRRGIGGQVEQIRAVLETGRSVCFFPEATTKGGRDVLPFRPSLFSTLYPPIDDYLVQPIAIDYGDHLDLVAWGHESGTAVTRRIFRHKGSVPVTMTFLPKLDPADMDRKQMAAISRQMIVDTLEHRLDGAAPDLHLRDEPAAA